MKKHWRAPVQLQSWVKKQLRGRKRLFMGDGVGMYDLARKEVPELLTGIEDGSNPRTRFSGLVGRMADQVGIRRARPADRERSNGVPTVTRKEQKSAVPIMAEALVDAINERVRILVEHEDYNTLATIYEMVKDETKNMR